MWQKHFHGGIGESPASPVEIPQMRSGRRDRRMELKKHVHDRNPGSGVPDRLVAFVAYFCGSKNHSKPHWQPEAERNDRDQQILPVIHGIEVIADLLSAIPAMNGLFLVHVPSS